MAKIVRWVVTAALAGMLAGACGSGGAATRATPGDLPAGAAAASLEPAAPAATGPSPSAPGPSPTESLFATPTPRPTEVPGPPSLALRGTATGAVPGELGSFLWDGLGSDAPWVVPSTASRIAGGERLGVVASPPIAWDHWTARWAPVAGGTPGNPAATAEGGTGAIPLTAPSRPGAWALALEVSFGEGRRGTWYWRFNVDR